MAKSSLEGKISYKAPDNGGKDGTEGVLLKVDDLKKYFPLKRGLLSWQRRYIKAVDGISFSIGYKECFGLVGESGSGKTTAGRVILRLLEPSGGKVFFKDVDLFSLSRRELYAFRKKMQIIFQDPVSSLNPRMTVGRIIAEGMILHRLARSRKELYERVAYLLEQVGLSPDYMNRYPHEFSGGQRQRIGIARALAVNPEFIVADEPVSALDVSIQAQILNLLSDLKERFSLSFLFIAHNLAVVEHFCDRVGVMYRGRILEVAPARELCARPVHPYTQMLVESVPKPDPACRVEFSKRFSTTSELDTNIGESGCLFADRCPYVESSCRENNQELSALSEDPGHLVACWKFCK